MEQADKLPQRATDQNCEGGLIETDEAPENALRACATAALPDTAELHNAQGDGFHAMKRYADAIGAYRKAVQIDPAMAGTWYSLGCAHNSLFAYADAAACFREAVALRPDWREAQHNLGRALFEIGQVEQAMEMFSHAAKGAHPQLSLQAMAVIAPGSPACDNQAVLEIRRTWAQSALPAARFAEQCSRRPNTPGQVLRIGYLSSFFQRPNYMKPVWGLINQHDRSRFEVHIFSDSEKPSGSHCHNISKFTNEDAAGLIARCNLDLLIDLNGYSAPDRLPILALRPARAIAGWFNMYATSGTACYDYMIGDDTVIPPEEEKYYSEKVMRVPGSYLTFDVKYAVPEVAIAPRASRPGITFGCLASQYKITNEVVAAWSRILCATPGSTLFLKNSALGSADIREHVKNLFEAKGIASGRIRLEGPSEHYQFLKAYDEIDVALDTFPYNGGTTTTEAIWQGVPVLTFWGDRWVSRTSASILRAANLGSFVSTGIEEYVAQAIETADSADMLKNLRLNMRSRLLASPVCDTQNFARNMERIYTDIITVTGELRR